MRGMLPQDEDDWSDVKVDLFYFKNLEEIEKKLKKDE